jgi:uncharacterized oxidoreductase
MAHETRFTYDTLHAFACEVLAAAGASPSHTAAVAAHLADSNLAGHDSHGVHRLLQYTGAIEQGSIDPKAAPRTVRDGTTTAVLDATAVFGQVAGLAGTELAISKARAHGTAVVGVRSANHIGRAGVYALRMATAGLVGQVFCSGRGAGIVAPWGGTTPLLSTNPIAVGVPTAGDPVVLDCTTSVTAEGKVRVARFAGKELPPGQILDREGRPSTRPEDLYDGGSMLPLGADMGHKGYGLSVIVDLLGATLAGGRAGAPRDRRAGFSNNFTLWAADPDALGGRAAMEELQQEYCALLKSSTRKPGVEEILLPGEPELRTAAVRRREGLPLDDGTVSQLDELATRLGLKPLSPQALAP